MNASLQALKQPASIQRSFRSFFMLEKRIDVALFGCLGQTALHLIQCGFRVFGFSEPVIGKAGGNHLRHLQLIALRNAEGDVVLAHKVEDAVSKPTVIAKLNGGSRVFGNAFKERSQTCFVVLQERRKLEEYRPELVRRS